MTRTQIEAWALRVIDNAISDHPSEDAGVELKSIWPEDHSRVARQIAAHANAARGEPILWVIGVDEKARRVVGTSAIEMADWWAQVK